MKYKELLEQLRELTPDQLELETLVMIRDKEKFVRLNNGLYFVTEFDEYDQELETDYPYYTRISPYCQIVSFPLYSGGGG